MHASFACGRRGPESQGQSKYRICDSQMPQEALRRLCKTHMNVCVIYAAKCGSISRAASIRRKRRSRKVNDATRSHSRVYAGARPAFCEDGPEGNREGYRIMEAHAIAAPVVAFGGEARHFREGAFATELAHEVQRSSI